MKNHSRSLVAAFIFSLLALPAGAAEDVKDWNFLVFLNGVNNLDSFGSMNINQMEEVGSSEKLNIIVQWGSLDRDQVDRLLIRKDADPQVTSPVVGHAPVADMGDWRQLVDFAKWAQDTYPARRTFIVVWNHGSGWHRIDTIGARDISFDDRTGHFITTEQLGTALHEISTNLGRKVDIYASDACLMGMAEIADEVSDSVDYYLGSQDLEPGEGWPYNTFLRAWSADFNRTPADVAKLLSAEFLKAYSTGGIYGRNEVTMSAYDLSKLGRYREAIAALAREIGTLDASSLGRLKAAAGAAQGFYYDDYRDAWDFLDRAGPLVSAAYVREAQREFVIANDQNQGPRTHGVSIWLPSRTADFNSYWSRYEQLSFNRHTGWGNALRKILGR